MVNRKRSFILYADQKEVIEDLTLEEKGKLLDALFEYAESGDVPEFEDKMLLIAFKMFKVRIEHDNERYSEICKKRQDAINKRWEIQKNTNVYKCIQTDTNDTDKDKDKDSQVSKDTMREYNNPPIAPQGAKSERADASVRAREDELQAIVEQQKKEIEELKNNAEQKKKTKKEMTYPEDFDNDFKLYNRKGGKKKAYEGWRQLSESDKEKMRRHIPFYWKSNEPQYLKDFERYISQRVFESVVYDKRNGQMIFDPERGSVSNGYTPSGRSVIAREDGTFLYFGGYDGFVEKDIYDGYEDKERPDGASIILNNGRGTAVWNKKESKWVVNQ